MATVTEEKLLQALRVDAPAALVGIDDPIERARAWRAAMYDAGCIGFGYPVELGGVGGGEAEVAWFTRLSRGLVPAEDATFGIGVGMALPTIREHGTPELQQRFIRPGLRGDEIWCQLYSEPGAGSDLAALSTRAERDGDEWLLTGQKVWTSGAMHADLAILLARTDSSLAKHAGITMFVLPMHQPGVEVRPLRQMTGASEFNEVFLDNARVPADWIVGELNGGWSMATALLAHERVATGLASTAAGQQGKTKAGRSPLPYEHLVELVRNRDLADDALTRQELSIVYTGEQLMKWLRGRPVHPSIGKLWRTKQGRTAAQLAHRVALAGGAAWTEDDADRDYWAYHILNCRAMSIGGGTDEVQRNTLGERVLGLPREPQADRGIPFKDIPR